MAVHLDLVFAIRRFAIREFDEVRKFMEFALGMLVLASKE
jgi:hypothetical protein